MVSVWVAGKTVIPLSHAGLSALEIFDKALYKFTLLYLTLL